MSAKTASLIRKLPQFGHSALGFRQRGTHFEQLTESLLKPVRSIRLETSPAAAVKEGLSNPKNRISTQKDKKAREGASAYYTRVSSGDHSSSTIGEPFAVSLS